MRFVPHARCAPADGQTTGWKRPSFVNTPPVTITCRSGWKLAPYAPNVWSETTAPGIPADSAAAFERLALQMTQPIPDLDENAPGIPPDLKAFIEKATQKDPAERYATTDEVKDTLLAGLRDQRTGRLKKTRVDLLYSEEDAEDIEKLVAEIEQLIEEYPQVQSRIK